MGGFFSGRSSVAAGIKGRPRTWFRAADSCNINLRALFRMTRPLLLFVFCLLAVAFYCSAKDKRPATDSGPSRKITLAGFLSKVAAANLDYAAQRYNVSIAKALIAAAKVSPNPTVSAAYFGDISAQNHHT